VKYKEEYLKAIIAEYQPNYAEPLTLKDAEEIADNSIAMFKYLDHLYHKYAKKLKESA
jgi:hypothetical protein